MRMVIIAVVSLPLCGANCGASCRYAKAADRKDAMHSPPPPPPLDKWGAEEVSKFVSSVPGMNGTHFKEEDIDGSALHELWIEREEQGGRAAWQALTSSSGLGARLRLAHRLRGAAHDASKPRPPLPPPPDPYPPPPPARL